MRPLIETVVAIVGRSESFFEKSRPRGSVPCPQRLLVSGVQHVGAQQTISCHSRVAGKIDHAHATFGHLKHIRQSLRQGCRHALRDRQQRIIVQGAVRRDV